MDGDLPPVLPRYLFGGGGLAWGGCAQALTWRNPLYRADERIVIQPAIVGKLTWVRVHHDSPSGRIVGPWRREGRQLSMDVAITANTRATVFVPGESVRQAGRGVHPFRTTLP